jgi:ribosomal protein S18 acetylase RimI-like enzyme
VLEIKKSDINDLDLIRSIAIKTFVESFANENSNENMELYLKNNLSISKLKAEFEDPDALFFLAYFDAEAVAYLKLNLGEEQTLGFGTKSIEIERIYVLSSFQHRQIGKALLNKTIEIAKVHSKRQICLGVWEKNHKAISFYKKHGFREIGQHVFMLGNDAQNDLLMQLDLL